MNFVSRVSAGTESKPTNAQGINMKMVKNEDSPDFPGYSDGVIFSRMGTPEKIAMKNRIVMPANRVIASTVWIRPVSRMLLVLM